MLAELPVFEPIFVYQMAKVGSSTIVFALQALGKRVYHVHRMNSEHLDRIRAQRAALGWSISPVPAHDVLGLRLRDSIVARKRRAKVITLVRDPIARNLSSYFEHLDAIWNTPDAYHSVPLDELQRGFADRFTHDEALTWFEDELLPVFGIDVYEHPFPPSGHLRIAELLVLKTELDDMTKSIAIAEFLGLRNLSLQPANVTQQKSYGEVYRRFVATLRLDSAYVDRMLNARYTRHFYTDAEREAMRRKYS